MEAFELCDDLTGSPLFMLNRWCQENGLSAGFTTRQTGNVALHVGDAPFSVVNNRKTLAERLGWPFEAFTCAEQVHGCEVRIIKASDAGSGRQDRDSSIQNTDALITNVPDVLLTMFFADCVPLYFYDSNTKSMGLAHAGWKGTVADIAAATVGKMQSEFGALPADLKAAIGPSIGGCCYEVDESVLENVRPIMATMRENDPLWNGTDVVKPSKREGRAYLDLKHLNRQLMIKAGIMPSNIEMSSWCTGCRTDLLFSHRMENGATGRMMSWLGRKSR